MKLSIEIETHDRQLAFDLAASPDGSLRPGVVLQLPGNATLELEGVLVRKAFGIPEVLQFILDAAINVELGLVATWLYDAVKAREVEKLTINRRAVTEITPDGIRQVIEEEIRRGG